jgi:hypothetical protein
MVGTGQLKPGFDYRAAYTLDVVRAVKVLP